MKNGYRRAGLLCAVSIGCLDVAIAAAQTPMPSGPLSTPPDVVTEPQQQPAAVARRLRTAPPPGFESLSDRVDTLFDLSFRGRRVGVFRATADGSTIRFENPTAIVAALGDYVVPEAVLALLTEPLSLNEEYRCVPGQTVGCDILPSDMSGVIVNRERFSVELFLTRELLTDIAIVSNVLGPPTHSGFSLIQTANVSLAGDFDSSNLRYGGTFETLASRGRTAFIGQTILSDSIGAQVREAYLQHIWTERRAAGGLLPVVNTLTITNLRLLGGQFGSFYLSNRADFDPGTPIEVLLPRRAAVEVYRDGVLLFTQVYEAGLQLIDTSRLPAGSYPVQIIARDGAAILLDETRTFTRINTLPPPGKIGFTARIGERVDDLFIDQIGLGSDGLFPRRTGELVATIGAERRIGRSSGIGVQAFAVDSEFFGEISAQTFRGRASGVAAVAAGSEGSHAIVATGSLFLRDISFSLNARSVRTDEQFIDLRRFRPFFRSEDSLTASTTFRLFEGSATVSGSIRHTPFFGDQYTIGARYARSFMIPGIGRAQLAVSGSVSDIENRFLITFTHIRRVGRRETLTASVGAEAISGSRFSDRDGFAPVARAAVSRIDRFNDIDVFSQVGASTSADSDFVFGSVQAASNYGTADANIQYGGGRGFGSATGTYLLNASTGFAFGGGVLQVGLRSPERAMVIVDIEPDESLTADGVVYSGASVAEGGYRVTVDNADSGYIRQGSRVAIGLPPFEDYDIALRPDGAPQFDLDRSRDRVVLYPGNVARVTFGSTRLISMFGQAIDASGVAVADGVVTAGSDFTVTDSNGYFTVTAPTAEQLTIRRSDGSTCVQVGVGEIAAGQERATLARVGVVRCQ